MAGDFARQIRPNSKRLTRPVGAGDGVAAKRLDFTGPRGLGALRAAPAIGALTMSLVIARFPITRKAGERMFVCVGIFGIATVIFGLSRSLWLSLVALAIPLAAQGRGPVDSAAIRRIRDRYKKTEVRIRARDGVQLFTAIYAPRDTSRRYPIMMSRTPTNGLTCPLARVRTMSFGTPKGRARIAAVPMVVPADPPRLRMPSTRP